MATATKERFFVAVASLIGHFHQVTSIREQISSMNPPRLTFALLAVVVLLALIGCGEKILPPPVTNTSRLIAKVWVTRSYIIDKVDKTSSSFIPKRTKFNSDSTYTVTTNDGTVRNGTWGFNVDETNLVQDKGLTSEFNWNIRTLSDSILMLRVTATLGGQPYVTDYEAVAE